MNSVKELVEENNEKRKLLNKENERLYSDFLLYIRTDLRASEYESEEILMELLNHLLEGQEAGKSAHDLFGNDPRAYAEELLEGLPSEKKQNVFQFVIVQIFNQLGQLGVMVGILLFILSPFVDFKKTIPLSLIVGIAIFGLFISFLSVKIVFHFIRSDLFQPDGKKTKKMYWRVGISGAVCFGLVFLLFKFLPDFGPQLSVSWWLYILIGACFIVISKLVKWLNKRQVSY